jgi:hypothetical protein
MSRVSRSSEDLRWRRNSRLTRRRLEMWWDRKSVTSVVGPGSVATGSSGKKSRSRRHST